MAQGRLGAGVSPDAAHRRERQPLTSGRSGGELDPFQLGEIAIEGTEREMPALAGIFENEDIREAYALMPPEFFNGSRDDIVILNRELVV